MLVLLAMGSIGNSIGIVACIIRVMDHGGAIKLLQSQQSYLQQQPPLRQSISIYPRGEADPDGSSAFQARSESHGAEVLRDGSGLTKIAIRHPSSSAAASADLDVSESPYRLPQPNVQAHRRGKPQ